MKLVTPFCWRMLVLKHVPAHKVPLIHKAMNFVFEGFSLNTPCTAHHIFRLDPGDFATLMFLWMPGVQRRFLQIFWDGNILLIFHGNLATCIQPTQWCRKFAGKWGVFSFGADCVKSLSCCGVWSIDKRTNKESFCSHVTANTFGKSKIRFSQCFFCNQSLCLCVFKKSCCEIFDANTSNRTLVWWDLQWSHFASLSCVMKAVNEQSDDHPPSKWKGKWILDPSPHSHCFCLACGLDFVDFLPLRSHSDTITLLLAAQICLLKLPRDPSLWLKHLIFCIFCCESS